ncbi:uncharacterized protein LOC144033574 [Festucalex cinctus]
MLAPRAKDPIKESRKLPEEQEGANYSSAASSAAPGIELDSTVPVQPLEDGRWNELGAKPKRVGRVSLTPSPNIQSSTPHSDWQTAHNNRSSKSPHLPDPLNPRDIQLSNRFGVFHEEDFPPLDRHYGSGSRDQRGNQPRSPGARPAQGRPRSPCSPSAAGSAVTKAPPAVTKRSRNRRGNKPRSPGARPPQGCQRLPCSPSAAGSAVTKATPAVTEAAVTTRGTRPFQIEWRGVSSCAAPASHCHQQNIRTRTADTPRRSINLAASSFKCLIQISCTRF